MCPKTLRVCPAPKLGVSNTPAACLFGARGHAAAPAGARAPPPPETATGVGFPFWGVGFRDSGFGTRVSGIGFRDSGVGIQISGFECRDSGFGLNSGFGIWDLGFGRPRGIATDVGFGVLGFGFRVSGFGIRAASGNSDWCGVWGFAVRGSGFGIRDSDFEFRDSGLGIRVSVPGFGFRVSDFGFTVCTGFTRGFYRVYLDGVVPCEVGCTGSECRGLGYTTRFATRFRVPARRRACVLTGLLPRYGVRVPAQRRGGTLQRGAGRYL